MFVFYTGLDCSVYLIPSVALFLSMIFFPAFILCISSHSGLVHVGYLLLNLTIRSSTPSAMVMMLEKFNIWNGMQAFDHSSSMYCARKKFMKVGLLVQA